MPWLSSHYSILWLHYTQLILWPKCSLSARTDCVLYYSYSAVSGYEYRTTIVNQMSSSRSGPRVERILAQNCSDLHYCSFVPVSNHRVNS
ncbi:uncharacterized protein BO95DRAFT_443751 [Aspergillus brunneoviolaceus CBS 621.78]|uniref:Uncharacterized protein n=1 Tax=Aspergillus brunneoviolaceus CBS 621.78 TaxID=1450534 RepID=A0ACD1G6E1_9EURO|nr:hypothetical protein BO95DRAFT_443751 [Aspergillus brunneoviolaceus CBS 621.78]RAH44798.1 hypothetical protein BO95DRAFT_443751 [Aspergillus brunneoviolaceus CBS 621.78]